MDDKQTSSLHELNSNPLNLNSKSVFSISKLINTNHQIIQFAKKLENPELLFKDSNTSILSRTSSWSHTIANQHLRNAFVLFPPKYEHRVKLIIEENEMESPNSKSSRLKSKSDTTFDRSSIASSTSCLVYPPKSDKSFDDFNNKRSQSAVNKTPASSSTSSSSSSARTRSSRRTPRSKSHATNKSAATKESKETKTPVCNTLAPNTVAELQTPKLNKNLVESNRDDFKQSISNITADASSGANATMSSRSDSSDETNKNKRSSTSSASSGESVYMSPMSSSLASSHQAVDQLTTDAAAKNMPVLSSTLNMQAPSSSSSMRQENALALANASTTEQQAVSAETPKADRPCSTSETTNSDSNQQQQQHQQVEIDRQVVVKEWQICADSELMMLRRIDHGHPGSKSKTSEEINRRIEADNRHLYGSIDDFFNSLDDYTSTFSSASASLNHANETETRTDLSHTASDEPDSSAALSLLDADSKLTNDEDTQHTNATCDDESSAKRHASKKRVRLSEAQPTVMLTTTTTPANPAATNTASSSSLSATAPSTTSTTATSPRFPHTSTKSLYAEIFTFFAELVYVLLTNFKYWCIFSLTSVCFLIFFTSKFFRLVIFSTRNIGQALLAPLRFKYVSKLVYFFVYFPLDVLESFINPRRLRERKHGASSKKRRTSSHVRLSNLIDNSSSTLHYTLYIKLVNVFERVLVKTLEKLSKKESAIKAINNSSLKLILEKKCF